MSPRVPECVCVLQGEQQHAERLTEEQSDNSQARLRHLQARPNIQISPRGCESNLEAQRCTHQRSRQQQQQHPDAASETTAFDLATLLLFRNSPGLEGLLRTSPTCFENRKRQLSAMCAEDACNGAGLYDRGDQNHKRQLRAMLAEDGCNGDLSYEGSGQDLKRRFSTMLAEDDCNGVLSYGERDPLMLVCS